MPKNGLQDVCKRIIEEKQGMTILRENAACGMQALQHRSLYIMRNIAEKSPGLAKEVAANQGPVMVNFFYSIPLVSPSFVSLAHSGRSRYRPWRVVAATATICYRPLGG